MNRHSAGLLGDVRVIELTDEKGQYCGKLLAGLGADVIKVEPLGGAAERRIGPFYQDRPHPERSLSFWHYNTSKRGITLSLENATGRSLLRRLIATADVVLESRRPGYLPSLGLGYSDLEADNPRLVMCSLTPFGQTGPWRDFTTSDLTHLAAGGQMASSGYNEWDVPDPPPIAPGGGNAWHMGGNFAAVGIISALCYRNVTGQGQYVDASIHEACVLTTEGAIPMYLDTHQVVHRNTGRHHTAREERSLPTQLPCKDARYINISIGVRRVTPSQLQGFARWMDSYGMAGDLLDTDKYQTQAAILTAQAHIHELIARFFATCVTAEEAYHGSQKLGQAWAAVRSPDENVNDPHWHDRGLYVQVEHPELGRSFTYPGPYALASAAPLAISRRAPLIGEHNAEVFGELGISAQDLALLRENGVV